MEGQDRAYPDARPICYQCGQQMVRTHVELADAWQSFWACECKPDADIAERADKMRP